MAAKCSIDTVYAEAAIAFIRRVAPTDPEGLALVRRFEYMIQQSKIRYVNPHLANHYLKEFQVKLKAKFNAEWFIVDDIVTAKLAPSWTRKGNHYVNTKVGLTLATMKKLGFVENAPAGGAAKKWRILEENDAA